MRQILFVLCGTDLDHCSSFSRTLLRHAAQVSSLLQFILLLLLLLPEEMEEVWEGLTLASLRQAMPSSAAAADLLQINPRASPDHADAVDRRRKRMIKNRESAARSRARKQAYTRELEKEVDHLEKENKRLKRQAEELKKAIADQISLAARSTLQRTLTAPF